MLHRPDEVGLAPSQDKPAGGTQARRALSDVKHHLRRSALKLVGYLVAAYLVLRLVPTLEQALRSLKHVSWEWVAGAVALEVLSETGSVQLIDTRLFLTTISSFRCSTALNYSCCHLNPYDSRPQTPLEAARPGYRRQLDPYHGTCSRELKPAAVGHSTSTETHWTAPFGPQ